MQYLIDEQLPSNVNIWKSEEFVHVRSIKPGMTDFEIWEFAKKHGTDNRYKRRRF